MSASPDENAHLTPENIGPEYERARERAEVLLTEWGQRLGAFASTVGSSVQKAAARAREEAEDIWAEAQAMRKESQSPPS